MKTFDWNKFRKAYLEARVKFLPAEGVLGVGYGPRLVDGQEVLEEPSIHILMRKQLPTDLISNTQNFPADFQGFPIIVREPSVSQDDHALLPNRSHVDLSTIDWVKVHYMHQQRKGKR